MNNQNQFGQMQDKDLMFDMLATQKSITGTYSTYANECACPELRDDMLSLLREEHEIQADVWGEISNRGWYSPAPAEQPKIDQARQKFASMQG